MQYYYYKGYYFFWNYRKIIKKNYNYYLPKEIEKDFRKNYKHFI